MPREQLQAASEALRRAAEAAGDDDAEGRIYDQSNEMAKLATGDRGPDHGRLARHERILDDLADETGGEAAAAIREALEAVRAYRETIDGV